MQRQSADRVGLCPILAVAGDGMMHIGGMHADLILTTRIEREMHQRIAGTPADNLIIGHCQAPLTRHVGGIYYEAGILRETTLDIALILLNISLEHSHIEALEDHIVPIMAQHVVGSFALGEHHEPGGVAVKTMDHPELIARIDPLHIVAHYVVGILFAFMALCADREHAISLVDYHHILILIDQLDARMAEHREGTAYIYQHLHLRLYLMVEGMDHLTIDHDMSMAQPLLDRDAPGIRHHIHHKLHQLRRLLTTVGESHHSVLLEGTSIPFIIRYHTYLT